MGQTRVHEKLTLRQAFPTTLDTNFGDGCRRTILQALVHEIFQTCFTLVAQRSPVPCGTNLQEGLASLPRTVRPSTPSTRSKPLDSRGRRTRTAGRSACCSSSVSPRTYGVVQGNQQEMTRRWVARDHKSTTPYDVLCCSPTRCSAASPTITFTNVSRTSM